MQYIIEFSIIDNNILKRNDSENFKHILFLDNVNIDKHMLKNGRKRKKIPDRNMEFN